MHAIFPYQAPQWSQHLLARPSSRIALAQLPTPLQPWAPPDIPDTWECWIKRDDLTGATLSGNKVRKLEFLLAEAISQGCDIVLTCGGLQSNHCRATAVAARQTGLESILFLRTPTPESPLSLTGNLLMDRVVGAQIQRITPEQYRQRTALMEEKAQQLRAQGRRPYIVPEGGSNALGSWGYIEAIRELSVQLAQLGQPIDDIVFACGSGGTAAGIAAGLALAKLPIRAHAINVCDDAAYFYAHINTILQTWGISSPAEDILDIIDGYMGLGYALSREEELQLLCQTAANTGIFLDPVYSGKALYGLTQALQKTPERFQGKRILFWHTGGLFGLYDKADQLESVLQPTP
ncbi:MAG: D-cysteine desulfhydrase family protein [Myxococcales bacterium]|nr:D-cysteine desulfhydrase family protein [Myxococcales bacterium]MCB9643278.1 D-cysteine desulfhydrase family protein [Myxococcales bacterium]